MRYYLQTSYAQMQGTSDCGDVTRCPQKLYLDITEDCNLWCRMCREKRSVRGAVMPVALFRRIVEETAPYVRGYSLFNWGEPLTVPDFRDRVRFVNEKKRPDCGVEISTNGMLLNREMAEFLARERVRIIVSVDGANRETFETIRRGAVFERVMENARYAAEVYQAFPPEESPEFYVSIQRDNETQIAEIVRLSLSLGLRRFGCGLVTAPAEYAPRDARALCRELERAFRLAEDAGMLVDLYPTKIGPYVFDGGMYQPAERYLISTVCPAGLVSATVSWEGDVYLCCNVGERVGSVRESSFLELWRSASYDALRRALNDPAQMPAHCRHCAWANRNP